MIVADRRIGDASFMRCPVSLTVSFACLVLGVATFGCSEGFEDTFWDDDTGTRTLSLFDGGAAWEERALDATNGRRDVVDGLRFEGAYTEADDAVDADLRCVSAKNASLATPCDTKVARKLACTLAADDAATLSCAVADKTIVLHRRGVRPRHVTP